jgi:protein SCO1/2
VVRDRHVPERYDPAAGGSGRGRWRFALGMLLSILPVLAEASGPRPSNDQAGPPAAVAAARYERSVASYAVPDVTLVDQDNRPVSLGSLLAPGKGIALNFVFTTCNAVCPVMTATFARMRSELGPDGNGLRLVSISIDPDHDTPTALKSYASRFGGGRDWAFLTGDVANVLRVQKAFGAFAGAKTEHQALTFFRGPGRDDWVRIKGFASGAELADEYRRLRTN